MSQPLQGPELLKVSPHEGGLPLLLVLVGPTASGKTALALELAEQINGEIISCDSVAVYCGMDIGSAKPSAAEQARVPHHMIDVVTPAVEYTAGDYGRAARAAVRAIAARGRVPIVAGGTGLYLRALLDGFTPVPPRSEQLRTRLRQMVHRRGPGVLLRVLQRADPEAARRIHPNDEPKLIRAVEVSLLAGKPMSAAWQQTPPEPLSGFHIVKFGMDPPRPALYERIDSRCAAMFAGGLLAETAGLMERYGGDRPALRALGYAQAAGVQRGELSVADALAQTQQGHRNYAKRQLTWFRRDSRIRWMPNFGEECGTRILADLQVDRS